MKPLFACWLLSVGVVATLPGQSVSSTIVGTLTDVQDAMVPNATVTVTEQATGLTHMTTSNETGLFRVLNLKPGRYSARVEAVSFKALTVGDIELASAETRDLGRLALQVGTTTESVEVVATTTPVQTASSERSSLIDSNQLNSVA